MVKCNFNKAAKRIGCIFSEHVFLRTPLDGCFCNFDIKKNQLATPKKRHEKFILPLII